VKPVQRITLRPDGGLPMILRRRENYTPGPARVAALHPSG
jgi:hypothetical protein